MPSGILYLIPCPIADNTNDAVLSPQIRETVAGLDYFLVENLRTARRFVSSLKLGLTIESLQFEQLDKDTARSVAQQLLKTVVEGRSAGIISEAGCPGIADPGSLAVQLAHQMGIKVIPLVGPSSIFLALMASGMNGQHFCFHGYLPIETKERIQSLKNMESESARKNLTQLFMETPYRNQKLLSDLIQHLNPNTRLCVASNITAPDQFIKTLTIAEWKKQNLEMDKSPVIFVIQAGA